MKKWRNDDKEEKKEDEWNNDEIMKNDIEEDNERN